MPRRKLLTAAPRRALVDDPETEADLIVTLRPRVPPEGAERTSPSPGPTPGGAPQTDAERRREIRLVYYAFCVVMGLAALDQSIVATALPRIVSDIGGVQHISWVVSAYVLASTLVMPLYGKLSDQYGRKPLVYAAVAIFLAGSVLCGFAESMGQLIAFRAVQGLGGGGLLPLLTATTGDLVPPRERGRYQGTIGLVFALAGVAGPVVGGVITDLLSWHWIFYVNLPIGLAGIIVIALVLKHTNVKRKRHIDYPGAALLAGATTCLLLVLTLGGTQLPWTSGTIVALGLGALVLTGAFLRQERIAPEPVMPLLLFRNRTFVMGSLVMVGSGFAMQGSTTFFPLFFQIVLGVEPAKSGLLTMPLMLAMVVAARSTGLLTVKTGRVRPSLLFGGVVMILAFTALSGATFAGRGLWTIEPCLLFLGISLGSINPSVTMIVQNGADPAHMGVTTAGASFFRSLGAVIGVAVSGAILAMTLQRLGTQSGLPSGVDAESLMTGGLTQILALPDDVRHVATDLYRAGVGWIFVGGLGAAVTVLGFGLFIPESELRTVAASRLRTSAAAGADRE